MKLVNFDVLKARLDQLPRKVIQFAVQDALMEAAQPALAAARNLVKKDTGYLERQLKLRRIRSRRRGQYRIMLTTRSRIPKTSDQRAKIRNAVRRAKASGNRVSLKRLDWAFYSHFLEFGTKYMAPRPFMRPAMEGTKAQFVERFTNAMGRRVEAALRGYESEARMVKP